MSDTQTFDIDRSQRRLWPIWLSPGVKPVNVLTLFFSGMITIVFITSVGMLLPYLLHEHLNMPKEVQGSFTGTLVVIVEIVALLIAVPVGVASDRWGRRPLYAGAFLFAFVGFMLMPLARTPEMLILFRVIAGAGMAIGTTMLATAIADYPQNAARGKMISINGVITNIGVIVLSSWLFSSLPAYFIARGVQEYDAGSYTFWSMAALSLFTAGVTYLGLKGGRAVSHMSKNWRDLFTTGVAEVRKSRRLVLACGAYFVSRGDLTVFTTFFMLWLVNLGIDSGMTTEEATRRGGPLFGIAQLSMLVFTPVMGIVCDRFDRVTAVGIGMFVAFAGYLALGIVEDPFNSPWMYLAAVMGGAGEAAVVVSGPALVGQEATPKVRGSIIGVVAFSGAIGVLLNSWISGELFDAWMYQAPFVFMAGMNLSVCIACIAMRIWETKTGAKVPLPSAVSRRAVAAREAQTKATATLSAAVPADTTPPTSI